MRLIGVAVLALGATLGISAGAIPASAATPAIVAGACTSATWVHVDTSRGLTCYAHPGTADIPDDPILYTFCAGNNNGSFTYENVDTDKNVTVDFSAGFRKSYGGDYLIQKLTISKGGGSDSC